MRKPKVLTAEFTKFRSFRFQCIFTGDLKNRVLLISFVFKMFEESCSCVYHFERNVVFLNFRNLNAESGIL